MIERVAEKLHVFLRQLKPLLRFDPALGNNSNLGRVSLTAGRTCFNLPN